MTRQSLTKTKKAILFFMWIVMMSWSIKTSLDLYDAAKSEQMLLYVSDKYTEIYRGTVSNYLDACDKSTGYCKKVLVRRLSDWEIGKSYTFNGKRPREDDSIILYGSLAASIVLAHICLIVLKFLFWLFEFD